MDKRKLFGVIGLAAGAAIAARRRPMQSMRDDVVLITGASRGLGLAMAREFAAQGCRLAICARDAAELETARASLANAGADVFAAPCDVSDPRSVDRLIEETRNRFGRIDTLVNNAGIIRVAPVENMTIQDFEEAMAVMFWGVVYPTLAVMPEMIRRRKGRIAAITSIGGKVSVPHLLPYCCAKFAAVGFCEGLRAELARHGVKVIAIAPGLMRTGSHLKAEFKGPQKQEAAWFSLSATLPVISMSAERAARQAVRAIRRGKSEKILSTQANVLARANGMFPGVIPDLLGLVNRALPKPTSDGEPIATGAALQEQGPIYALTALGRRAARELNNA